MHISLYLSELLLKPERSHGFGLFKEKAEKSQTFRENAFHYVCNSNSLTAVRKSPEGLDVKFVVRLTQPEKKKKHTATIACLIRQIIVRCK